MEQRQADGGQSMGLRERKRRATRDAIERAAIATAMPSAAIASRNSPTCCWRRRMP